MASLFTQHSAHRPNAPSSANTDLSRHTSLQSHSSRSTTTWSPGLPQRSLPSPHHRPNPITPEQFTALEQQFPSLHADLTSQARLLLGEIQAIQQTLPGSLSDNAEQDSDIIAFLQALLHGKISSALTPPAPSPPGHHESSRPLRAIRAVSRDIQAHLSKDDPFAAIGLAIDDLRSAVGNQGDIPDLEREQKARDRMDLLQSAMPEGESYDHFWADVAMHLDHELPIPASAEYTNQTTLKDGVPVSWIPRERFLATNDGYAWDVGELVGEIVAQKGEFKNPVTGRKFDEEDVELVRRHPLGRGIDDAVLAAREQEQTEENAEMDGQGKGEERWEAKLSAQWAKQMHQNIRDKAEKEREEAGLMSGFGKLKLEVSPPAPATAAVELPATAALGSENVPSREVTKPSTPSVFPDHTTIAELPGSNEIDSVGKENSENKANAEEPEYKSFAWYNKYFNSVYSQP
ncbi:hypothetical protein QBC41DRAFT_14760 [Cercophora samala]|uniref:Uncharacterized protein n=1 Tax=Cercophora samala TaxID=330535 RepID=A0AA40D6U9_9PEZI|nr:hypothetical protein QBC41DRAFT_14760 [Cercophora samala]